MSNFPAFYEDNRDRPKVKPQFEKPAKLLPNFKGPNVSPRRLSNFGETNNQFFFNR